MEAETEVGGGNGKGRFLSKEYDMDSGVAEYNFGDGTQLAFNLDELSAEIQRELMFHGAMQKVGDAAAGAKGDYAVGKASCQAVIDQLKAGQWTATREGGKAKPRITELAAAISRVKNLPIESVVESIKNATDEQRKTWRGLAVVKAAVAQIREEKARAALAAEMAKGGAEEIVM